VIEDDESTRRLLRFVLEDAGYAVIELDRGEPALEVVRRERPALVLIDVRLPGVSGYEVCRKLREAFGDDLPLLFVSGERTESFDRVGGLLLGADDYLVKPFATDELLARVRGLTRRAPGGPPFGGKLLSVRELEVLRLLSIGLGLKEIAEHLVISAKTVSTHMEHIFLKLGVQSRAQAIAVAYREDLVSIAKTETAPPRAVTKRVSLPSVPPPTPPAPEAEASPVRVVAATPLLPEVPTAN
jgi:DNA-binding response OmpR family regulator